MSKKTDKDRARLKQLLGDRHWRLNNLYYIQDKSGKKVKFKLNESQQRLYDEMWYLDLILKDRQRGFSTFIAIFILDACIFNSNTQAGIIDINLSDAKKKLGKIKYAYDNLPAWLKNERSLVTENTEEIKFNNHSGIQVGTSHRGGTLQILHVSEFGKIAAKFPDKAREIRTGALNTVDPGQKIFIESTAEGAAGEFYDICKEAQDLKAQGTKLTKLDYKFHFFGWHEAKNGSNEIEPEGVTISDEKKKYFDELETKLSITINDRKRAWYVKKEKQQKDDMWREFPATPDEAFAAAIDGAYFARQMTLIRKKGQITSIPIDNRLAVNTFWDLGVHDYMALWLHQQHGLEHRFIGYYENSDEGFLHYANWLRDFRDAHGIVWGKHFAPHDIEVRSLDEHATTRKQSAANVGIQFITVKRIDNKQTGIELSRSILPQCWFDESRCERGITRMDMFRKKWNENVGAWSDNPLHDENIHGADAFQTFALAHESNQIALTPQIKRRKPRRGTVA